MQIEKYRKDIDGLRALAIISVFLFHLNNNFLPGGFVGVDIFFVISGFLITGIIVKEIKEKRFSFSNFYLRRIRRIFPALFLVLFISLIVATLILIPANFAAFAKALRYATLQASNILFMKKTDYFAPQIDGNLLLHTWSLGVEEQFYVVFPIILVILSKFPKHKNLPFYGLLFLTILSFAFSCYFVKTNSQIAFFSLPSRFFELAIGALIALKLENKTTKTNNEIMGFIGLSLIILSLFIVKKDNFPGLSALLPTLGTGLLIFSGFDNRTWCRKFLSGKLLVFIGLISYSLYLWHWLIIAAFREYTGIENIALLPSLIIIIISLIISFFSWKFIETPFRKKRTLEAENKFTFSVPAFGKSLAKITIYTPMLVSLGLIIIFTITAINAQKSGWNWRILNFENLKNNNPEFNTSLNSHDCIKDLKYDSCASLGKKFQILLIGDSHADHYAPAIQQWAQNKGFEVISITSGGCAGIFNVLNHAKNCKEMHDDLAKFLKSAEYQDIKYVFLGSRWESYTYKSDTKNDFLTDQNNPDLSLVNSKKVFQIQLENTVKEITQSGKKVVILGQVPKMTDQVIKYHERTTILLPISKIINPHNHGKKYDKVPKQYSDSMTEFANHIIGNIVAKYQNVTFFNPTKYLCDDKFCYAEKNNNWLYRDDDHINVKGSLYLKQYLDQII